MARLLGVVILAACLAGLAACSSETDRGSQRTGQDVQRGTEYPEGATTSQRTVAGAPPEETTAEGETASPTDVPASWDYVALGDSLAVGVGASRGYVARYADHVMEDTGARVRVVGLGRSGQTSSQLLYALRDDPSMRRVLGRAEIVTFNIGINDLGQAGQEYDSGTCGGDDNQECLRTAVEALEGNWDAIVSEILSLRSTNDTVIRTAGMGYTPRADEVFEPYVDEANRHIAATAADASIPYTQVHLSEEGMSPDGIHPNDGGYEVIAEQLRELGYDPLSSTQRYPDSS